MERKWREKEMEMDLRKYGKGKKRIKRGKERKVFSRNLTFVKGSKQEIFNPSSSSTSLSFFSFFLLRLFLLLLLLFLHHSPFFLSSASSFLSLDFFIILHRIPNTGRKSSLEKHNGDLIMPLRRGPMQRTRAMFVQDCRGLISFAGDEEMKKDERIEEEMKKERNKEEKGRKEMEEEEE